jgi:transcriptional regulator with XRE-family HTH domain
LHLLCRMIATMVIAERLRALREKKKLSQGDIQDRTGLLRCYLSRVENGHTVPSVPTLEKLARALGVPVYQLFYDGAKPPETPSFLKGGKGSEKEWGGSGDNARALTRFRSLLGKLKKRDLGQLLFMAKKMAVRSKPKRGRRTRAKKA